MPGPGLRTEPMRVAVVGAAVIAVSYGLGRYAFGLFVPRFQADLGLSATVIGAIGGASHLGYAIGLVAAPRASARFGAARVAVAAGIVAALGLAGVAASAGPLSLGAAILGAGTASGLASPALALVVTERLASGRGSATQTWVNSGTSIGLVVSAPAVLAAAHWRATWALFATVAIAIASTAHTVLVRSPRTTIRRRAEDPVMAARGAAGAPRSSTGDRDGASSVAYPAVRRPPARRAVSLRMLTHALALGATSAGYWTFSRPRVLEAGLSEGWSVGFWVAIGVVGLAGGSAGASAASRGLAPTLRAWVIVWIVSLGALAIPTLPGWIALASAGGFGAAYMASTGLLIVWSVDGRPVSASAGVRSSFLALGVGQAVATPLIGWIAARWGLPITFATSALMSGALLVLVPRERRGTSLETTGRPRRRR